MPEQKSIINTITAGLTGGLIAAVINVIIYFIAGPLIAELPDGTVDRVGMPAVLAASIVPSIFAALLLWGLRRFTGNATRIFQIIAVVFVVLSFFSPFSAAETTATAVWLSLMHVVAGGAIIWALTLR